jgi:hypothetical protein
MLRRALYIYTTVILAIYFDEPLRLRCFEALGLGLLLGRALTFELSANAADCVV